jgi:hypothetical protein
MIIYDIKVNYEYDSSVLLHGDSVRIQASVACYNSKEDIDKNLFCFTPIAKFQFLVRNQSKNMKIR